MFEQDAKPTTALVNDRSNQLFLIFTGDAQRPMLDPIRFLQLTGIARSNVLMVRDVNKSHYRQGISQEYLTLDATTYCIRQQIADSFSSVTELFSVGTSTGGLPAIYCGHHLKVKAIFCFGARVCNAGTFKVRLPGTESDSIADLTLDERGKLKEVIERVDVHDSDWNVDDNPDQILDYQMLQKLVELRAHYRYPPDLHLYYATTNVVDVTVARAFGGMANVSLHPIKIDARSSDIFPWAPAFVKSHAVVQILHRQELLSEVFREYL